MVLKANEISTADFYKALEILTKNNKWGQTHEIPKNTEGRPYRVLSLIEERTNEVR